MIENIIVGAIVLAAVVFAARSLFKTWSGKGSGCSCGGACKSCNTVCAQLVKKHPSTKR